MRIRHVLPIAALACLILPGIAQASFPGLNGRLSFSSNRLTGSESRSDILTAWPDGSDQRFLVQDTRDDAQSAWAPDGRRIAWRARRGPGYDIHTIAWDGTDERTVGADPAFYETQPGWSPDGRRIVFRGNRGGDYDIWIMDLDGSNLEALVDTPADERYPTFSPDGTKLAFRSDPDGNPDLFVLDMATREIQRLTDDPAHDSAPVWSPDGERIAFESDRAGSMDVYTMNADGTGVQRLTDDPALDEGPVFAPDGTKLVFTSERDGNSEIYVMDADGSDERNVSNHPAKEESPDWQAIPLPDGDNLEACGDAVESGPGAYSVHAKVIPCGAARLIAQHGGTGMRCTSSEATFGMTLVDCRRGPARVAFLRRPE